MGTVKTSRMQQLESPTHNTPKRFKKRWSFLGKTGRFTQIQFTKVHNDHQQRGNLEEQGRKRERKYYIIM